MHNSDNTDSTRQVEGQFKLARAWHHRGRTRQAIEGYRKVLGLDPAHFKAAKELGAFLFQEGRFSEAEDVFRRALEWHPNEVRLHKGLVDAFVARGRIVDAFAHYDLQRKDTKDAALQAGDIICCSVVRNESLRLPFFLTYYRRQGIARFFFVDNESTDGTLPYLLDQPDSHVWRSRHSFHKANFGAGWFEVLLRRHGIGHWCLIVDADELFYYPDCERRNLQNLCRDLERKGKRAMNAVLLDMYSDKPIRSTHYTAGQDFREVCPYFDRQFYHRRYEEGPEGNQTVYIGGARQRVFGREGEYYLSKVPLIRYGEDAILSGGQHRTYFPRSEIAAETGCILHFKYFSAFPAYAAEEVLRQRALRRGDAVPGICPWI